MNRLLTLLVVLVLGGIVPAPAAPVPPDPTEAARLVEKLGSDDFAEREAATKRLEELGTVAIEELRIALKSENAETVRRAQDLLRRAERRLANDKALAPTLVELDAKDQPLDAVLGELSKQAKCDVVIGGLKPEELAAKKITVSTGGKVPFWAAVLNVCEAADTQIAGVAGFYAPGSIPTPPTSANLRRATNVNTAVILEARDKPRRPASVYGAVLVEAVAFPKVAAPAGQAAALLQAWPEPRLQWEATTAVKVLKATDTKGAKLAMESTVTGETGELIATEGGRINRGGMVMVRNPDGTASFVKDTGAAFQLSGVFKPNARQVLLRLTADKLNETVNELETTIFARVRSQTEALCTLNGFEPNKTFSKTGASGVELTVTLGKDERDQAIANVQITYDPKTVQPAGAGDDLPGVRGGGTAGLGNHSVYGVRITDADGKPYILGLSSGANSFDPTGKRVVMSLKLELHTNKGGHGPPVAVTLWGTYSRHVEVPVTLKQVPLDSRK